MRWPWSRKDDCAGATAREEAETHLAETRRQWPEVNRVSASLRDLRERNHFHEQLVHIFKDTQ